MKKAPLIGVTAALLLIICCFIPLAYYPDLHENFTGFYSHQNAYGKPGFTLIFLSLTAVIFFGIPKLWAKRVNHVVGVLTFAYALKTFLLFSNCYLSICPQIKPGLIGILVFAAIILVSSLLSKAKITVGS